MVNGKWPCFYIALFYLLVLKALLQSETHLPIHSHKHAHIHTPVPCTGSNWGFSVLLKDTSTCGTFQGSNR